MRVLHVVPAAFGPSGTIGGAERYALELSRAMRQFAQVCLVAYGDRAEIAFVEGMSVTVIRGRRLAGNDFNRIGRKVLGAARSADVIHCHQHHVLSASSVALYGRVTGTPVVATDHGGGGLDISWYVDTDRLYSAHLHVSRFSRERAVADPRVVRDVIYGGVDPARFLPAPWDGPRTRALFVGRVQPHKRVDVLIAALPDAMQLDIVGPMANARYAADLRRLAADKLVTFHGVVDETNLVQMYRSALCVVLPSAYSDRYGGHTEVPELLGQTLLEGMACGIPAICTAVGGMPEIVSDSDTGFVIPPESQDSLHAALVTLLDDQTRAEAMGARGRRRVVQDFTWSSVARRCVNFYAGLLLPEVR